MNKITLRYLGQVEPNGPDAQPPMLRILHIVPSFYPATYWGGPIFSVKALCDGLASLPYIRLKVLTSDSAGPALHERLKVDPGWKIMPEGYQVRYLRRRFGANGTPAMPFFLLREILRADIVHLTSVYSFPTLFTLLATRLIRKPLVWSPRGELQATAQWPEVRNRAVKILYERLANVIRPKATMLQVTSQQEGACTARFPGIQVKVVPNGVTVPTLPPLGERQVDPYRLVFLSRIHEKKGIELLLEAMMRLPLPFTLDVYGNGDAQYVTTIKERAAALGDRISFHGFVDGPEKTACLTAGGMFVLPSHSENFGNVIAEALAHGMPVITTTNTPWHRLDEIGCGRCIPMALPALIDTILNVSVQDQRSMGELGRQWMIRDFSHESTACKTAQVYRDLINAC